MKKFYVYIVLSFFLFSPQIFCISFGSTVLSFDQKIGQLFMVTAVADEEIAKICVYRKAYRIDKEYIEQLIKHYHIGGIIYLGKSDAEKQIARTIHFQELSTIPLLVGQDLEPGRVGGTRLSEFFDFPSNQMLGVADDDMTYQVGYDIGQCCKALGVHINFAPVADVNNNSANRVIGDRSFGDNQELVARKSILFMQGLRDAGIIACAKHFPGHGDTDVDSHVGLPVIAHDKRRLHAIELYPFKQLIAAHIPAIMIGHLEVPAFEEIKNLPSSLSKNIVTQLLQHEMGFSGLIITDALDMRGVTHYGTSGEIALRVLQAGNDVLLCCQDVPGAIAAIKQALIDGTLSEQELDQHVEKIIRVKEQLFAF